MNGHKLLNSRRLSIAGFSFLFAYILSFQFEGQVLYGLLDLREASASAYILAAMIAHFAGLFTCGLFVRSQAAAKTMMLGGMGVCLAAAIPFFFTPSVLWMRVELLHDMTQKQALLDAAQKLLRETGVTADITGW